ncbi:MAG: B-box zinc finger protein, partial [Acidobacteriota bacterium]
MGKRAPGRHRPSVGGKSTPVSVNMRLAVSTDTADAHTCERHPETTASFQCDGCGKYLCSECAEEGHRLFFCALCGERALPLEAEAPATTPEHKRVGKRDAPYSLQEALLYPFRGLGGYVYWSYV